MARRAVFVISLVLVSWPNLLNAVALTSARARTLARFKKGCEDGIGKSCYDYGRALWSTPGAIDRVSARRYLLRGCELKYTLACESYQEHSARSSSEAPSHQVFTESAHGPCFNEKELSTARFSPNANPRSTVRGQRIDQMKPASFWARVGLKENDVIYNVNNMPFNNQPEVLQVFERAGKKFAFQVVRAGDTITLWYSCD